jgi:hypothetical protein
MKEDLVSLIMAFQATPQPLLNFPNQETSLDTYSNDSVYIYIYSRSLDLKYSNHVKLSLILKPILRYPNFEQI